jgi:acyl-CoA dehydrogenase
MDFTVPPELDALRRSLATFLEREVRPREEYVIDLLRTPAGPADPAVHDAAMAVKRRACEEGFYVAHLPEEVGGWGLSTLGTALLVEDAAASGLRLGPYAVGPPNPEAPSPLLLSLPEHLRDSVLPPLVRGETSMCFALTEPEAGSDAQAIRTRAVRDGDSWVLTGTKHYITNGDRADVAVVFAVTDPEKRAAGGITAFLVPRAAYDVGRTQWTLGDTHPVELRLDAARIPADHVVGEVGHGFLAAMQFLNAGRAFISAQALGLAEWCLQSAIAHALARTAFGKPLAKQQGVAFPLADCAADVESIRWLVYHLAWAVDSGAEPARDASIAKLVATERGFAVADRCLQVFGGMGLTREGPVEWALRHLRVLRVVEGASEIQRLVIARSLGL